MYFDCNGCGQRCDCKESLGNDWWIVNTDFASSKWMKQTDKAVARWSCYPGSPHTVVTVPGQGTSPWCPACHGPCTGEPDGEGWRRPAKPRGHGLSRWPHGVHAWGTQAKLLDKIALNHSPRGEKKLAVVDEEETRLLNK